MWLVATLLNSEWQAMCWHEYLCAYEEMFLESSLKAMVSYVMIV